MSCSSSVSQAAHAASSSRAYIAFRSALAPQHRHVLFDAWVLYLYAEQPARNRELAARCRRNARCRAPIPFSRAHSACNERPRYIAALRSLAPAARHLEPPESLRAYADASARKTSHTLLQSKQTAAECAVAGGYLVCLVTAGSVTDLDLTYTSLHVFEAR